MISQSTRNKCQSRNRPLIAQFSILSSRFTRRPPRNARIAREKGRAAERKDCSAPSFCVLREILQQQKRPSAKSFTAPASIRNSHCILIVFQIYYRRKRAANGILPVSIKSGDNIADFVNLLPASCVYRIVGISESRKVAA